MRGRVLVIDDDGGTSWVIADLLVGARYVVEHSRRGTAGLRLAEQSQPDAVLVNLALPMPSGLDVLNRLNNLHPTHEIPVTLVSAYAVVQLSHKTGGADRVPRMPLDLKEFVRRVRQVAMVAHLSDQLLQPMAQ